MLARYSVRGTGTTYYGRSYRTLDKGNMTEEFDTTLWFAILAVPVFPIRSERIRQQVWDAEKEWRGTADETLPSTYPVEIIRRTSLNWLQVAKTYALFYVPIGTLLLLALYYYRH